MDKPNKKDISAVQMLEGTEKFFKTAFCAESAKVILGGGDKFSVEAVVRINTDDGRGSFVIGLLAEK